MKGRLFVVLEVNLKIQSIRDFIVYWIPRQLIQNSHIQTVRLLQCQLGSFIVYDNVSESIRVYQSPYKSP